MTSKTPIHQVSLINTRFIKICVTTQVVKILLKELCKQLRKEDFALKNNSSIYFT